VLSDLIDHDQTGFLKGCSIAENIWFINSVISYTHLKDILVLLRFCRFRKSIRYYLMDLPAENAFFLLSQYADDTTMILKGSQVSLERSFVLLDSFGQLVWIASQKGSKLRAQKKTWNGQMVKFKALGVWVCTDQNEGMKMNLWRQVSQSWRYSWQ